MIPALMTLYLEQIKKTFLKTDQRKRIDARVIDVHGKLWSSNPPLGPSDSLYFTLLANQYVVSLSNHHVGFKC